MSRLLIFLAVLLTLLPQAASAQTWLPLVNGYRLTPVCTDEQLNPDWSKLVSITPDAPVCVLGEGQKKVIEWDGTTMNGMSEPEVQAADYFFPKKLNIARWDCWINSCALNNHGMWGIRGKMSVRPMTLAAGKTWSGRFYGSWMGIGSRDLNSMTCANHNNASARKHISIGAGIGDYGDGWLETNGFYPYAELFDGTQCKVFLSILTKVPQYLSLTTKIERDFSTGYWTARFWWNGVWVDMLNNNTTFSVSRPDMMMVGGELGASDNDFTVFTNGWIQNIEHIQATFDVSPTSWFSFFDVGTGAIPNWFISYTTLQSNYPFHSIGWDTNDHTSVMWYVKP